MAYTKSEKIKLVMFWFFILGIISFIIDSILAIAYITHDAVIAMFVIAMIFTVSASILWIYVKIKQTNRKVASN